MICATCQSDNPAGQKFCGECGSPLPRPCPSCGVANPAGQKFCGECGTSLAAPAATTPATPTASAAPAASLPATVETLPSPVLAAPLPSAPPAAAPPVEEERRLITALFCDLVGFTPLSEALDPEEVREIQTMYFAQMNRELHRFGGTVEKYAGDAVLALFGAPLAHEDDAERAVRCALAMQGAFQPVAEMAKREWNVDLAVRIGVNTGEAISGAWDVEGRRDYSATGDVVNTAARLQGAARPGGVIVGQETMHLARRAILFGPREDLTLKGKATAFPAYHVLGLREQLAERWETREGRTPLIGRHRELVYLLDLWERVQRGEGRLVTLLAEAGVGKSRLLTEAVEHMDRVAGTVTVRGRCLSYGEAVSLHLVADLLRNVCQLREGDDLERVRVQLRTTLDALLAPWDADTRDAAFDVIGVVFGLPPGISSVSGASPQIRRQALVRSLQLLLSALSTYRPAIIVLEDLHWIDGASAEVLEAALPALFDRKAMVLATRRPGSPTGWEAWPQTDTILLEPLPDGDALDLARSVLSAPQLDPELERQIMERAGGNPFFVEELLRSMQETGALEERGGRMGLVVGATEKLPSTLTELLLARLDQLERPARSTAQLGSVIGRSFAVPLLARISEQREAQLQGSLDVLERAGIAFPQQNAEREYIFKHATIREVAYNTLLLRRRQALHAATARAIIECYPVDDHVDLIAYHFGQTREHAEAALWLERSADRAASIFANDEAIARYRETRRRQDMVSAPLRDRARVDEKLGRILRVTGAYDDALQVLEAAVETFRAVGDMEGERRATAEIGRVHRARGTADEGIHRIKAILAVGNDDTATSGLAALYVVLARLYFSVGKYQEDFVAASRGCALAWEAGDMRIRAEGEMVRSSALYYLRQIEEALQVMEAAIPLAEAVGDFEVLSILIGNASVIYRDAGDLERSLQYQERSVHITERTGDLVNHAFALTCMGEITFLLGDWEGARTYLQRARSTVHSLATSWVASYPPAYLGRVEVARGDFDSAAVYLEESLSIARAGGDSTSEILGTCYLAEMDLLQGSPDAALQRLNNVLEPDAVENGNSMITVALFFTAWAHLECGSVDEADRLARLAVDRLTEENAVVELLIAQRIAATVAVAQGDYERAGSTFEKTIAAAHDISVPHAEACALYEYGLMHLKQGKREQACRLLMQALFIFRHLGAQPYIERAEAALARAPLDPAGLDKDSIL